MDAKKDRSEEWLKFDFPVGCRLDGQEKDFQKRMAAKSKEGGCCPYYFCLKDDVIPCDVEIAKKCAQRCEQYYEDNIKGGNK